MTTQTRKAASKWDTFDPEFALLGGVLQQACRDALQTANERLRVEAWEFLDVCAPMVAEKLRRGIASLEGLSTRERLNVEKC